MSDELREKIAEAAQQPAAISADGVSVTAQPLGQMIEADRYARSTEAAASPRKLLRVFKVNPGGAH